jgi:hypothetical protein
LLGTNTEIDWDNVQIVRDFGTQSLK